MAIDMQWQTLIIRSAMRMVNDIRNYKERLTFPHTSRTGLSQAQIFELLTVIDPLVPYYIRKYMAFTTTNESGEMEWTFLVGYTAADRDIVRSCYKEATGAVTILTDRLFNDEMPDFKKAYRACAFLCGSLEYDSDLASNPNLHNAYSALIKGHASCQGYAHALKLLLDAAKVPNLLICGSVNHQGYTLPTDRYEFDTRTKNTQHFWNLIGIETTDGIKYFHVDICWGQNGRELNFDYFLKDDAFMNQYLKWDTDCYPECPYLPGADIAALVTAE